MKIKEVTLLNGEKLTFGDFNVFIGGNGVGKTTFLLELFSKSNGVSRSKYNWINQPFFDSTDTKADMKLLKSSLARKREGANLFYLSQAVKNMDGNIGLDENLRFSDPEVNILEQNDAISIFDQVKYRRPFITFSSCEARLGLNDEVEITGLDNPPQDPINVLYRNKKLLKEIDRTIFDIFKIKFILLDHTKKKLHLGLAEEDAPIFDDAKENAQDEYERIQKWKEENFIPITEAGHGRRSMIRLLTSLLEPVNQVIMIDEPEMHLYPSQKRWLGKQLVNLAQNQNKQVFLVTHDPMVLQGILDANTTTNIFRVERETSNNGTIKSCRLERITDANAMQNQDQYLQGLFYQRCIIVEGASDRSFYQNMIENFEEAKDKDLGFVACGGKGNTKHMANIVSKVGLKAAFIYDFDVILFETDLVKDIYKILGGKNAPFEPLENLFIENEGYKNAKDQKEKNVAIKNLTGYGDKEGVTSKWAQDNKKIFDTAINQLETKGIFIVPKGTLESWAPAVEPKVRFAELAPASIKENADLNNAFKEFTTRVLEYIDIKPAGSGDRVTGGLKTKPLEVEKVIAAIL